MQCRGATFDLEAERYLDFATNKAIMQEGWSNERTWC